MVPEANLHVQPQGSKKLCMLKVEGKISFRSDCIKPEK